MDTTQLNGDFELTELHNTGMKREEEQWVVQNRKGRMGREARFEQRVGGQRRETKDGEPEKLARTESPGSLGRSVGRPNNGAEFANT